MSSSTDAKPAHHIDSTQDATQASSEQTSKLICGVCNAAPPKYKCPRCYLPYCSVACNKIHRENHPPDPEPTPTPAELPTAAPEAPPVTAAAATTTTGNVRNNPFSALDSASDKLRMLFTKYPSLPQQLTNIHAATQPPSETSQNNGSIPASLLRGLPNRKENWNHDVGIKHGKEALRKARKADGADGEAVREYCELIMYLMNGQDDAEAAALLQKQVAMQDSELIERLMAEEKKR